MRLVPLSNDEITELNQRFASAPADELLSWALKHFGQTIALSCGFGLEGTCVLDMIAKIDRTAKVFTLDTGRLPQETYDLIQRCQDRYGMKIDIYFPEHAEIEQMIGSYGTNLFYKSREFRRLCCHVRKVRPLTRALSGLHAWITGLNRNHSEVRAEVSLIERDEAHNRIVKINPLADWSLERVWEYVRANNVPFNALYDRGYTSIGCAPCTRAVEPGEDMRAGRWWWEVDGPKECGIHR